MTSKLFTELSSALSSAGAEPGLITTAASSVAGLFSSHNSTIKTKLNQLMAVANDPAAVSLMIGQLETTDGLSPGAIEALTSLRANPTAQNVLQTIMVIEATL